MGLNLDVWVCYTDSRWRNWLKHFSCSLQVAHCCLSHTHGVEFPEKHRQILLKASYACVNVWRREETAASVSFISWPLTQCDTLIGVKRCHKYHRNVERLTQAWETPTHISTHTRMDTIHWEITLFHCTLWKMLGFCGSRMRDLWSSLVLPVTLKPTTQICLSSTVYCVTAWGFLWGFSHSSTSMLPYKKNVTILSQKQSKWIWISQFRRCLVGLSLVWAPPGH